MSFKFLTKYMEAPNYYAVIPADVRYAKIPANAKLLYGEITALTQKEGYCWASNAYFARLYGVSIRSIINRTQILEKKGFIKIEIDTENGNERRIELVKKISPPSEKNFTPLVKKFSPPSEKNFTHNNTYNNTSINNTNNKKKIIKEKSEFLEKIAPVINKKLDEGYNKPDLTEQADLCWLHHQETGGVKIATTTYNNWINNAIKRGKIVKPKKKVYATPYDIIT